MSLGYVITLAGSGSAAFADGTGTNAAFYYPQYVTLTTMGAILVADYGNNRIRSVTSAGVNVCANAIVGMLCGVVCG